MGGQQLFHALEKGVLSRRILVGEIQLQLIPVQLLLKGRVCQKTLDLAAKQQGSVLRLIIVQRLDAEMIPRAEQRLQTAVPDGEGEHAPQPGQKFFAPLLIAVKQHLGVRPGGKGVPGGFQFLGQLLKIVNFSVKDHNKVFVLVEHGLFSALQVNDGQPTLAQRGGAFHKLALPVRPAMGDQVHHLLQNLLHFGPLADESGDSTHNYVPLCFRLISPIIHGLRPKEKPRRKFFVKATIRCRFVTPACWCFAPGYGTIPAKRRGRHDVGTEHPGYVELCGVSLTFPAQRSTINPYIV